MRVPCSRVSSTNPALTSNSFYPFSPVDFESTQTVSCPILDLMQTVVVEKLWVVLVTAFNMVPEPVTKEIHGFNGERNLAAVKSHLQIWSLGDKIGMGDLFKGVIPFVCADLVRVVVLIAFPIISLWLPNTMFEVWQVRLTLSWGKRRLFEESNGKRNREFYWSVRR